MLLKLLIFLLINHSPSHLLQDNMNHIRQILKLSGSKQIISHSCQTRDGTLNDTKELFFDYPTSTRVPSNIKPESQAFLLDLNCPDSKQILNNASKDHLFRTPFVWILYGDTKVLEGFYIGPDTRVYIADSSDVTTIYKLNPNSTGFVVHTLDVESQYSVTRNRRDLMGSLLKFSTVVMDTDSLNHLTDYRDTHVDSITKLNFVLVNHLIDFVNASREYWVHRTWGYEKNATTGLYKGLVGDLQTGKIDIGGTPLFFRPERVDIVEYIAATTPTYMKFIFRAPPLTYVTNVFTLPFDKSVWHCSFIMLAVIGICIFVISLWEWKDDSFRDTILKQDTTNNLLRANVFEVIMLEIGAVTQQGSYAEPKSSAGRIATVFTFLVLMFMYTAYSANVVALLQSTSDSIRTVEDLLTSRIKLGVDDIVYAHYYFENAQEPIRKAIYEQKVAPKGQKSNFMSIEKGIQNVQEGFFAFHVELSRGYYVIGKMFRENEKCGLREIEYVSLIEPWLPIKKHSSYKELLKLGMRQMIEAGIQKREYYRVYTRKPACHTGGSNFDSVGLIDCEGAFLIFGIGIGIAFKLWILELIIARYVKRKFGRT